MNLRSNLTVELVDVMGDWTDVVKSARYSTTMDLKSRDRDLKLLQRLWDDKHLSPFEMVETVWHVEAPIFVARQWMRHRTWSYNEFSQRYSESKLEFWLPAGVQPVHLQPVYQMAENAYKAMLGHKKKEAARTVLPLGTFTYFRAKTNFRNLIAFLQLRTPDDVQPETRAIALQMVEILQKELPELMEVCWNDDE